MMRKITHAEFLAELRLQGVPEEHCAFRCPICGTIQSLTSLHKTGEFKDVDEGRNYIGFSCIGRFNGAEPWKKGDAPGKGCNWTLGGLLRLHTLEVELEGKHVPSFEIATPEEAKALMAAAGGVA